MTCYALMKGDETDAKEAMEALGIREWSIDHVLDHGLSNETKISVPSRNENDIRRWFAEHAILGDYGYPAGTCIFFWSTEEEYGS